LISLFIAVSGLAYNTWRNETTEEQRNVRHAAFTVLEELGTMQDVVNARYYYFAVGDETSSEGELRLKGYGSVLMARDLMGLMPEPAPATGKMLHQTWVDNFDALDNVNAEGRHTSESREAEAAISGAIEETREAVLAVIRSLE
jgi:hypothetical protein